MPYIALPLLGLLARSSRAVINLAILGTVLNFAGVVMATSGAPLYALLVNHLMSGILVWMVAYMSLTHLAEGNRLWASLHEAAFRDPLTGLFNRRYVFDAFRNELKKHHRYGDSLSIILIDADHFKQINDQHGHPAGDAALKTIARACNESIRDTDVVGRFGGEEFIILLPHTTSTAAEIVAERIRKSMLRREISWQGQRFAVRLSCGIAEAGVHADDFDALIAAADQALYSAKKRGRNQTRIAETPNYRSNALRAA